MKIKYTPKNTVFVTGSVPTGSRIMAAGAKGIKNVTLGTEAIVFFNFLDVGIFFILNVMANISCGFYHYFPCL